jgi:leucine dehydrogenase
MSTTITHQEIVVRQGQRSGLTMIAAVHSTRLGPAAGGCRFRAYPTWRDGPADAMLLSEAMSYKCAVAGLSYGGGKTVVVLPGEGRAYDRRAALLDVGDLVESLGGRYKTGPDVGTSAEDMAVIRERTAHVGCPPRAERGSASPAVPTATGVLAAIRAVAVELYGATSVAGRRARRTNGCSRTRRVTGTVAPAGPRGQLSVETRPTR